MHERPRQAGMATALRHEAICLDGGQRPGGIRPRWRAAAAAAARLGTESLVRMRETCTLAVLPLMNSSPPISRLVSPPATKARTSISRGVRSSRSKAVFGAESGGRLCASSMRARRASASSSSRSGRAPSSSTTAWAYGRALPRPRDRHRTRVAPPLLASRRRQRDRGPWKFPIASEPGPKCSVAGSPDP